MPGALTLQSFSTVWALDVSWRQFSRRSGTAEHLIRLRTATREQAMNEMDREMFEVVESIAAMQPFGSNRHCLFCGSETGTAHLLDCAWLKARNMVAMGEPRADHD
jgi:hypothetical protein